MKAWVLVLGMALFAGLFLADPAMAQSPTLRVTCRFLSEITRWLIGAGFVCGTIGLVFISIKATATGRFRGGPFVALMGGMFVLGSVPAIVSFFINGTFTYTCA